MGHLSPDGSKVEDENIRNLFFGDYGKPDDDAKAYDEISDLQALQEAMEFYLDEFNSCSKAPMALVMFQFAIEHVSRICRVLKQDSGHALLVGIGGSGRQSATKLAAFINDYDLVQIELTKNFGLADWRDSLKQVVLRAGLEGKQLVFLLADSQIKNEAMVEDVNMLLNTGDVPNMFAADECADIIVKAQEAARVEGKKVDATPLSLYTFFIDRVKANLHIVLGMKPLRPHSRLILLGSLEDGEPFGCDFWKCLTNGLNLSRLNSHEPYRGCVQEPSTHVPFPDQLLHHRLVPGLAHGCPRDGGLQVLGGR